MKRDLLFTLALIIAFAVGYFTGYTNVLAPSPTERPQLDPVFANTNGWWLRHMEAMTREDQRTAFVSFRALRSIEHGEIQQARESLVAPLANFYRRYGPADHPREPLDDNALGLLRAIRNFSQTNTLLRAELERRYDDSK
jgi:hypothetical protein